MGWPRLRLRTKLLLAFALVLLPLLLLAPAEFHVNSQRHIEHALQSQEVVAEAFAAQIDAMFDAAVGAAWTIAADPTVQRMEPEQLDVHLRRLAMRHPLFDRMAIFDASGVNRGWGDAVTPAEPRLNIADASYFQAVMTTNSPTVSQVVSLRRPEGLRGVVAAAPIRDDDDRVIGVVTVAMSAENLAKEYEEVRTRAGQAVLLIDRTGRLAFDSRARDMDEATSVGYANLPAVRRAMSGVPTQTPTFISPLSGDERLGAFVPTREHHWVAAVTMPREVALAPMRASMRVQIAVFLAMALLSLGLALLVAWRLTTPVRRLQDHARALGEGDLARRVDIRTGDEMEDLGAAFNDMAAQVQRLLGREQAARAQAEAANQAKDQFMAMVSHELRTPLTPVMTAVELLRRMGPLPEDGPALLDLVQRNVELEARLIDDLLDMTRLAQARMQLRHEVVDVHALLRQVVDICRNAIEGRRIHVELDLRAAAHHVHGDSGRLQQVFSNIIGNAVKFTPEQGRVVVRTRQEGANAEVRTQNAELPALTQDSSSPTSLVIEITDTGIGIDPEVLARLFRAFEQGDQSRTRQFGGLGLGLCISKGLVEMHGGRVEAFSEGKGRGATFTVTLPAIAAPALPRQATPTLPTPAGRCLSILLVDDNGDTLRMLSTLLRHMGHSVHTAASAGEAFDAAQAARFDLLISDIGLPDATGWELMRRLRGRGPIHGIALSGFGTDEDIRQSRQAGFADHLTKPVNVNQLEALIGRVPAHQADGSSRPLDGD